MDSFNWTETLSKRVIGETFKRYKKLLTVLLVILFFVLFITTASASLKYPVRVYYFDYENNRYEYDTYYIKLGRTLNYKAREREGFVFDGLYYDNRFNEEFNEMTPILTDTHLFAKYIGKEYTVTLDHNGGVGPQDTIKVLYKKPLPELPPPERQGYLFAGYFDSQGNRIYSDLMKGDSVWNIARDSTIYARWAEPQTIPLDKQGGEGGDDFVIGGLGVTLPEIEYPAKAGVKFNGYYSEPDGKGTRYYAYGERGVWDQSQPKTLYAYWAKTIIFDKQGGTGGTDSADAVRYEDLPPAAAPQKDGYTFDGYYSKPNGKGKQYYSKDMAPLTQWDIDDTFSVTLFANWLRNYTVTLQTEIGESINITVNKDRDMPAIPNNLSRPGYLFGGYYSLRDGKGVPYYDATYKGIKKWNLDDGGTLYAYWVAINSIYTRSQGYIIMGEYPQTIATPEAVSAMRHLFGDYYISDYDGARYFKVYSNPYESVYKFSNNEPIVRGREYYFKVEPIRWKILKEEGGRIYVISEKILDVKQFNTNANNNWEKSTLREWLNNTFYYNAFTANERIAIAETQLENRYVLLDLTYQTRDCIFLPSYEDMINPGHGFEANDGPSPARAAETTDFARAKGAWTGLRYAGKGYYWLRTGIFNNSSARVVFADGNVYNGHHANDTDTGIRPAMYIKAS